MKSSILAALTAITSVVYGYPPGGHFLKGNLTYVTEEPDCYTTSTLTVYTTTCPTGILTTSSYITYTVPYTTTTSAPVYTTPSPVNGSTSFLTITSCPTSNSTIQTIVFPTTTALWVNITLPGTTLPATTIPGTTIDSVTTVPGITIPGVTIPATTEVVPTTETSIATGTPLVPTTVPTTAAVETFTAGAPANKAGALLAAVGAGFVFFI